MPPLDHISVCICTYRRIDLLGGLLASLARQQTDNKFSYSIVVVDNDAEGSARTLVEAHSKKLNLDMIYAVESEHTIPAARNHALRLARGNYIAIIDDDEFPPSNWLLGMYEGIQTFHVDGSLGPVFPFFATPPPRWLVRSGLCELPTCRTGTLLHWSQTRTGNVLLKKEVFDGGLAFDRQFRTGGSDQEFFRQAAAQGRRFVAIAEAPVYEFVPPKRWTRKYWIKRAMVNGFNAVKYARVGMSRARRTALMLKSLVAIPAYLFFVPVCACAGQHRLMSCLEKGAYHVSRTCACVGIELWNTRNF